MSNGEWWSGGGMFWAVQKPKDTPQAFPTELTAKIFATTGLVMTHQEAIRMAATQPTTRWAETITAGAQNGMKAISAFRDSEYYWPYLLEAMKDKNPQDLIADTGWTLEEVQRFILFWNDFRSFLEQSVSEGDTITRQQLLGLVA